jgi:hypothetical protein
MIQVRTKARDGFCKTTMAVLAMVGAVGCDVPPDDEVGATRQASVVAEAPAAVADHFTGTIELTFTVQRFDQPLGVAVPTLFSTQPLATTLHPSAQGGAACTPGVDFISVSDRLVTIPANATSASTTVTVCGDNLVEGTEQFMATFHDINFGNTELGSTIVLINDDPFIKFANASVREPLTGSRELVFTLGTTQVMPQDVFVTVSTVDGTATSPAGSCSTFPRPDYIGVHGRQVKIPAGQSTGTFSVSVCADSFNEPNETFSLSLSNPINGIIAVQGAIGTIVNQSLPSFP